MTLQPQHDDATTAHRRARLRELVRCFGGQIGLIKMISERSNKEPNQGELSALAKDNSGKSFREVKARNLEKLSGLPTGWFDLPLGTDLPAPDAPGTHQCAEPVRPYVVERGNEEALLIRAFRIAPAEVRLAWLDQATGLVARYDTPSELTGTNAPKPG